MHYFLIICVIFCLITQIDGAAGVLTALLNMLQFIGRLLSRLSTRVDFSRTASLSSFRTALSGGEGARMAIAGGRAISKGKVVGITLGGAAGGILSKELLEDLVEFFKSKSETATTTPTPSQEHFDAIIDSAFPVRMDVNNYIIYVRRIDFYPEKLFDLVEKRVKKKIHMLCYESHDKLIRITRDGDLNELFRTVIACSANFSAIGECLINLHICVNNRPTYL